MNVVRLVLGQLDANCFLANDGRGGPLVVIDPAGDWPDLEAAIAGRAVAAVVLTHAHFDHMGAAEQARRATDAPLLVHEADAGLLGDPAGNLAHWVGADLRVARADRLLRDGDVVEAGELDLRVLHTPGHTPGCVCLYAEGGGRLFSGDTLFALSVGRTDLPGSDGRALSRSIAEKLAPLPDDVVVHPGHGPDTTMGREKRLNPFFPRA